MKTIKAKILAATLCILVVSLIAVGGIAVYMNYTSILHSLKQTLSETIEIAVNQVDRHLQEYRTLVTELAAQDAIVTNNKSKISTEMQKMQERHGFTLVERTDANGICVSDGQSIANRDYYIQARDSGRACVSDPAVQDDGSMNLFVAAPVMKNGQFDGVLFVGLDASFLCELVTNIKVGGTGNAAILNREGTTIAYEDLPTVLQGYNTQQEEKKDPNLARLAALEREMIAGNSGFGDYSYNGVEKFLAYAPVPRTNGWSMDVSVVKSEFLQGAKTSIILILLAMAVCMIIAVLLIFRMSNAISFSIQQCVKRIQLLAKGDLKTEVPEIKTKDETYLLAEATKTIASTMKGIIMDLSWGLGEMAKGNFTIDSRAKDLYVGDFQPISIGMYQIIRQLTETLRQINQSSDQVSSGSDQVAASAQALSQGATEQASSIEELAATINDISEQVSRNAANAQDASQKATETGNQMQISNLKMQEMMNSMEKISSKSGEIEKIIKTIEDIAFQTNILALNAAVEAARAGAAGKGFAVVASEVRDLASKSAKASKNTSELIEDTIQAVAEGTKIASETAQTLDESVKGAKLVTDKINEISDSSKEQATSITQITQGIDQISSVVQTNSATAEESAAASEELSSQAQILKGLVEQFKLKDQEILG